MKKRLSSFVFLGLLAFSVLAGLRTPCQAETPRVVPQGMADVRLSYAPVVKSAAPAVVNIYTRKIVRQRVLSPFMNDPFFQHFFGDAMGMQGAPTRQRLESSLGSGVIVRPDGLIVTSNHVVDGADEITVVLADRREFPAEIVAADKSADLAALKINTKGEKLPHLEVKDSDDLEVGDLVIAIGNPFGVGQTVTSGIISALARTTTDINDMNYFIQTDAAINPGNSGGALVTMDGKLVGINAAIFSRDGGNMGIGFAVPSNIVRAFMEAQARGEKTLPRVWTGLKGQPVTADVAESLGLSRPAGFLVSAVQKDSPADKAKVKTGDVILTLDGKPAEDVAALRYRLMIAGQGRTVTLGVFRKGESLSLPLVVSAPPARDKADAETINGSNPLTGVTLGDADGASDAMDDNRNQQTRGAVLLKIPTASSAARLGLLPGDVLLAVNDQAIANADDAKAALKKKAMRWHLKLWRRGTTIDLIVGG